jgi:hypothetical protein
MSQEDAEIVKESLMSCPGVGEMEVDWRTKEVRVVTSNQDGGKSVLEALLHCGFPPES